MVGVASLTDLPARAKVVAQIADEHADAGDRQGALAQPVVDALHREGLYGMWVPRSVRGGAELDPVSSLQVIEGVSYGDPSTGWVLMAAALAIGTGAAYLEDAAVSELFDGDRLPVIAGQGTRPGTAVPRDGGFLLTGSWSFASGIKHSTHIHTLGIIEGTGEPRIFVLPVGKATLIDNWDVLGLRGTGSIDYRIDGAFVPQSHTHFAVTEAPKRGGSLYTLGIIGFAAICHSGWACGIGRRLLDELTRKVHGGVGRSGTLANSDSFLEEYAKAEGTYRGARALVYETWSDIKETLDRGERLSVRQHTMMRLAMANVTWSCHEVADFVYKSAGTVALRAGTIQRLFRDMHAGTQHITSAPPVFRHAGRELAGLADGKKWLFLELVDDAPPPARGAGNGTSPLLDAASAAFLASMREAGGKPLYEQTVEEARATVAAASERFAGPAAEVHAVVNKQIPVRDGKIGVRIYTPRPPKKGESLPIVLHYHGGGFVAGDLDTHDSIARYYCRHSDAVVVSVDYRRPPEHRFPVAAEDAYAAFVWAVEHAQEIHADRNRVAVVGDSAGGNLAAVVCQLAKERGAPRIALQALIYPVLDFTPGAAYPSRAQFGGGDFFLSTRDMEFFASLYLNDAAREARDPRLSPLVTTDLRGLPPALVVTSGCDLLRDEGKAYADRLSAAGVPVEYRCFEGTIHAFMSFAAAIPLALEGLSFVASRLRSALRADEV